MSQFAINQTNIFINLKSQMYGGEQNVCDQKQIHLSSAQSVLVHERQTISHLISLLFSSEQPQLS